MPCLVIIIQSLKFDAEPAKNRVIDCSVPRAVDRLLLAWSDIISARV